MRLEGREAVTGAEGWTAGAQAAATECLSSRMLFCSGPGTTVSPWLSEDSLGHSPGSPPC